MSSPDPVDRRRLLATLALGLLVGGCFTPLYAERSPGGGSMRETLAQVEVVRAEGRLGHEIREALIFALTGGAGNPAGAPYQLVLSARQTSTATSIDRTSGRAVIEMITVTASYTLTPTGADRPVLKDQAFAKVTVDRGAQLFARDRAVRDAENNAAQVIAEQIRARLASFFITGPPPAGPGAGTVTVVR